MKLLTTFAAIFVLMPLSLSAEKMGGRPFPWDCPCWFSSEAVGMYAASFLIDDCVAEENWSVNADNYGLHIRYQVMEPMEGDCFITTMDYDKEFPDMAFCEIRVGKRDYYPDPARCDYYSSLSEDISADEVVACKAAFHELKRLILYVDSCD